VLGGGRREFDGVTSKASSKENRHELTVAMSRRGRRKGGSTVALDGGERPPVAGGGRR
jgi:hypothetical protein